MVTPIFLAYASKRVSGITMSINQERTHCHTVSYSLLFLNWDQVALLVAPQTQFFSNLLSDVEPLSFDT